MKTIFLGLIIFGFSSAMAEVSVSSSNPASSANYCAIQHQAMGSARGYGSQMENCNRAQTAAESAALFGCFQNGHSDCDVVFSRRTAWSHNSCDYEAIVRATAFSECDPRNTFLGGAWAKNFGSEFANCEQATRIATDIALSACYRSGINHCVVVYEHIVRTEGNFYCEVSSVVKGQEFSKKE